MLQYNDNLSRSISFKRGSYYSRKELHSICCPGEELPRGGDWLTGYVRIDNALLVFMNIGIPGKTGHDFNNQYNPRTSTVTWYGKPRSHSQQPTFQKLIKNTLTPHFFARWEPNTPFLYLGEGTILNYKDGVETPSGKTIECSVYCNEVKDILEYHIPSKTTNSENILVRDLARESETSSSFLLEKHLEEFLIKNWQNTIFGKDYTIYEDGNKFGQQFPTDTGPLDILAQRKDRQEFLVLELKRDKASDIVIGQTMRYMGYVQNKLALNNESVRGCIIASQEDQGLRSALAVAPNIDYYRYKLNFSLEKQSF